MVVDIELLRILDNIVADNLGQHGNLGYTEFFSLFCLRSMPCDAEKFQYAFDLSTSFDDLE